MHSVNKMASLASKDSYLQNLAKKVCAQPSQEPRKRKHEFIKRNGSEEPSQPKKKKKKKPRNNKLKAEPENGTRNIPQIKAKPNKPNNDGQQPPSTGFAASSFSTVDILRKRLQEKIQESRGQVSNKSLTPEEVEKRRQRRKQERERKKRKRKELKKKAAQEPEEVEVKDAEEGQETNKKEKDQVPIVFNNMEVSDELPNKVMQKKAKKERVKGNITPMTGKNYKQLLGRLEARKTKLEELREKDEGKAKEFESKIKWTNVLYKAEGVKIKDDEGMLKAALKRKEKMKKQREKRWDKRTELTAERMQQRQDKRRRNITKKKQAKVNKKKDRARKKGRILPEDLAKANFKKT
ncbi:hypothetical protein XENTR_v10020147 [Xenopus tropicalis]|uniref:Surfeit locus protein 6 isoform X1 n=3 Tax=Xenopus tropicalis TaxID=8364 RepID=A0A1B8Y594_XENTR|nr:surfeit locus protein 6 isoform X1 [Xenopus tropicalis]KAE8582513.1 hypothetical protein XENTR_v10020147 [Xenopus tropicalis]|eukprot:XP_012823715.1 PREDICTED: surfeit locus protein 6 isoform X1 [Xenopus tropicalis]